MHLVHRERVDEVDAFVAAKELFRGLAHIGAQVHRVDKVHVRIGLGQLRDRAADVLHRLAVVLAAVRGDQHDAAAGKVQRLQRGVAEGKIRPHSHMDGVHHRVADDRHARGDALAREVVPVARGGREVQ